MSFPYNFQTGAYPPIPGYNSAPIIDPNNQISLVQRIAQLEALVRAQAASTTANAGPTNLFSAPAAHPPHSSVSGQSSAGDDDEDDAAESIIPDETRARLASIADRITELTASSKSSKIKKEELVDFRSSVDPSDADLLHTIQLELADVDARISSDNASLSALKDAQVLIISAHSKNPRVSKRKLAQNEDHEGKQLLPCPLPPPSLCSLPSTIHPYLVFGWVQYLVLGRVQCLVFGRVQCLAHKQVHYSAFGRVSLPSHWTGRCVAGRSSHPLPPSALVAMTAHGFQVPTNLRLGRRDSGS